METLLVHETKLHRKSSCDTESQKHLAAGTRSLSHSPAASLLLPSGFRSFGELEATSASISQAHILPTLTPGMTIPA